MKTEGSGFISQRHGSADPDPDPHQNVMDPQHWKQHAQDGTVLPLNISGTNRRHLSALLMRRDQERTNIK